jgi:threonine/homoserine/homoserine lactone efflux protein
MILGILNTLAAAGLAYLVYMGANFPDPPLNL